MLVAHEMPEPPLFGTNRCDPPRTATISVFLKCQKCRTQNCFADVPVTRADLTMFRGSEERVKCRGCGAIMDTMGSYVGARAGGEIVRRPDPEY
jgi:hypothetical protein